MTYLNDRVIINIPRLNGTNKTYIYTVEENDNLIFIGNVFLKYTQQEKNFDITNLVIDQIWVPDPEALNNTVSRIEEINIKSTFTVKVYRDYPTNIIGQGSIDVIKVYKYPHFIKRMYEYCWLEDDALNVELQGRKEDGTFELTPRYPLVNTNQYHFQVVTNSVDSDIINIKPQDGYTTSFEIEGDTTNHIILALDELLYNSEKLRLPYTTGARDNCGTFNGVDKWINFPPAVGLQSSIQYEIYMPRYGAANKGTLQADTYAAIQILIDDTMEKGILAGEPIILNFINGSGSGMYYANLYLDIKDMSTGSLEGKYMYFSLGYVAGNDYSLRCSIVMDNLWTPNTCIYVSDEKVALLDECPAPYYLQWQDRMGSFQSQPFNGKIKFSETFDKLETINYFEKSKLSGVNTTAKWKIRTDYIPEDLYPYYESIFISPYLILYDVENDITYEVKVTGDWTEKYYREGRKMINLELDLEEVKKQKFIY